jgi:hypothetical protein
MARLLLGLFLAIAVPPGGAETYLINPEGTGDFETIQEAIAAALDGDVIELTDGTFTGDGNRDLDYLGKAITIRSQSGNPEACVINCELAGRGCHFHSGEEPITVLEGVTITNGLQQSGWGGGIACMNGSSPTLSNCILRTNTVTGVPDPEPPYTGCGGGLFCTAGSSPAVTGCTFVGNASQDFHGGGALCEESSHPTLVACTFLNNRAFNWGGGLCCRASASPTLDGCVFTNNVGYMGGAILCVNSSPEITNVIFVADSADFGGAIMTREGSSPTITGCSFTDNWGECEGGAICGYFDASPTVTCCTLKGNGALYRGGAVLFTDDSVPIVLRCTFAGNSTGFEGGAANCCGSAEVLFRNCTFYGNSAGNGGGVLVCGCSSDATLENSILAFSTQGEAVYCWSNGSATLSCCDVYGNAGGDWVDCIAGQEGQNGNICADPLFCDADGGNFTLHGSSPCLAGHHPEGYDCGLMGAWPVGCPPGAVDDEDGELARPRLLHAAPNPFCGSTRITFAACGGAAATPSAPVTVGIYDPAGRLIRTLVNAPQADGVHTIYWDGTDRDGRPAPAGAYFCRIRLRGHTEAAPIILAR